MKISYEAHEKEYRRMESAGIPSWFRRNRPWDIDPHDEHFLADVLAQPWAPKTGVVIELGCGTGPLTRWLANKGCQATGIDISPTAIRMAQQRSPTGKGFFDTNYTD
jgi:2-polyprenyl-3-methyl-5-hydroxy-6-metoxy-1,4-benzoquinol methylase